MFKKLSLIAISMACLILNAPQASAAEMMKPFVLSSKAAGTMDGAVADAKAKVTSAGFDVVGEYAPYPNAHIIIVTSDALKAAAAKTEFGAYGAAQRIAVTDHNGEIQVSYTNPTYMAAAYRMDGDLADVTTALKNALGDNGAFGTVEGMTDSDLRDYHYMFMMPYFDDPNQLGQASSYQDMLDRIEANLASGIGGVSKVFRIDIPGREQTVFGVSMKGEGEDNQDHDDTWVMSEIDFKDIRSTAHLPVEIVVSGKYAWALSARFRIAINFPDLSMTGDNSFMNIMSTPVAQQKALTLVAGGKYTGDGKYAE